MIISQDALRKETVALIRQIETQIDEVKKTAEEMGIPPETMRDTTGNWVMTPLLMAKAQAYASLILLQAKQ